MQTTEIQRCGRCLTILTAEETAKQRDPERIRCNTCDCVTGTNDFLDFSGIPARTREEAKAEWVKRTILAS